MTRIKPLFLMATLTNGEQVVAEFSKLEGSGENYVAAVFGGRKTFNAWRVIGHEHPVSGEKVLLRQRLMLNGRVIDRVEPVQPVEGHEESHGYLPSNFERVTEVQAGPHGRWVCPTNGPEGIPVGTSFPVHRDEASLEKYVILKVATPTETNPLDGEVRFWVDRNRVTTNGSPLPEEVAASSTSTADESGGYDDGWTSGFADGDDDDDTE